MASQSRPLIIADSSPLIALSLLDLLPELRNLAYEILIPATVGEECTQNLSLPAARQIQQAISTRLLTVTQDMNLQHSPKLMTISALVDPGKAQAIALAQARQGLLLTDDKAGRHCAKRMGIPITGSLGVMLKLKQSGRVTTLKPLLEKLGQHGYRYSSLLIDQVLETADEKSKN